MSVDTAVDDTVAERAAGADIAPIPLPRVEFGAEQLQRIVEGALLAAGKPLTLDDIAALFDDNERPSNDSLRAALTALAEQCAGRGFELREVASGFRFQVVQEVAPWIARLWEEKPQRYSRALLETLALVAYRQPITRGDIEDIRGVTVASNIIKTLLEREWVRVVGHKDVPGRPALYATTRKFLDYFNLKNLDELPTLAEIRDLDSLNAELALEGADTVNIGELSAAIGGDSDVATAAAQGDGSDESPAGTDESPAGTDESPAGTDFQDRIEADDAGAETAEVDAVAVDVGLAITEHAAGDNAETDSTT